MGENEIQDSAVWVSILSVWKLPLLLWLLTLPQLFSICETILPSASQQKVYLYLLNVGESWKFMSLINGDSIGAGFQPDN